MEFPINFGLIGFEVVVVAFDRASNPSSITGSVDTVSFLRPAARQRGKHGEKLKTGRKPGVEGAENRGPGMRNCETHGATVRIRETSAKRLRFRVFTVRDFAGRFVTPRIRQNSTHFTLHPEGTGRENNILIVREENRPRHGARYAHPRLLSPRKKLASIKDCLCAKKRLRRLRHK